MSRHIVTVSALALLAPATPALAQDYEWTGFYIGAHGSVVDTSPQWTGESIYQTVDGAEGGFTVAEQSVAIDEQPGGSKVGGGGRLGFNWQAGNFVIGAEADASFFDFTGTETRAQGGTTYTVWSHATNLETIRARAGVAFGPVLLFATGGVAFTNLEHSLSATNVSEVVVDGGEGGSTIGTMTSALADTAKRDSGWTAGGGGEVQITDNLSVALTLLHVDLGEADLADSDGPNSIAATVDSTMFVGMLGINFRF